MKLINKFTVSTKKEEPKKKETATAILLFLSLLSVQPHGFTPNLSAGLGKVKTALVGCQT